MSDHPDLVVLVRTLEPSAELGSTLELVAWLRSAHPDLTVRLVATRGGAWGDRAAAAGEVAVTDDSLTGSGARTLLRVGASPVAQAARSAGLRRALRTGTAPVLVDASAGGLLNWIDARASRVVAHVHHEGPHLDQLPHQDRVALDQHVTHWADGMDLLPQGATRDDRPGVVQRSRAELDRALGLVPGAPLLVLGSGAWDVLPSDTLLALTWALVGRHRGLRVLWATEPLQPPARLLLAGHLADAGLQDVVIPVEADPDLWCAVAAADAVVASHHSCAAGGLGSLAAAIAPHRTRTWDGPDGVPEAATISDLLPGGRSWEPPAERWHAATGGPAWLRLLGLDLPVA